LKPLAAKLDFALKAVSINRARLASILGMDKSAVGRWMTGAVTPSPENLARLTAVVAERSPGFSVLDWERDLDGLAAVLGVRPPLAAPPQRFGDGLPLACLDHSVATTTIRGAAYEGFFRSTRPYAQLPGQFIHDHIMVRRDANGLLRASQRTAGVSVEGWLLLLDSKLFLIGTELTTNSVAFAILNGVSTVKAGLVDGLILTCALDPGRTPTATPAVFERIGDLSGDVEADAATLASLAAPNPVAPPGSLSDEIIRHLTPDIGPGRLPEGGDWLLHLPLAKSISRGLIPV
jgi:transcriptional regulator with XRE-family HTH domain